MKYCNKKREEKDLVRDNARERVKKIKELAINKADVVRDDMREKHKMEIAKLKEKHVREKEKMMNKLKKQK